MANPVNPEQNIPRHADYTPYLEAISYIPLVGIFTSYVQEQILYDEVNLAVEKANMVDRIIPLIELANKYKTANIARNLLTAALIIGCVALNIIPNARIGGVCALLSLGICALDTFQYAENKKGLRAMRADRDNFHATLNIKSFTSSYVQRQKQR